MKPFPKQRWFVAIALDYSENGQFFDRDAGLQCLGFRELGVDARLLAFGEPCESGDKPLVLARLSNWEDPDWWRQWNLDGVVLTAWGRKRYEPVAKAIKAAGIFLIHKMDSDGIRAPQVWPARFASTRYAHLVDSGTKLPLLNTRVYCLIATSFPRWYGQGTVNHLEHADLVTFESPIAKQRFIRFLESMGSAHLAKKIIILMHPVTSEMRYDPKIEKKTTHSSGRWLGEAHKRSSLARQNLR